MKKQNLLLAAGAVLIILVVIALVLLKPGNSKTPEHYAQARETKASGKCLEANKSLTISDADRNTVELVAMSHLIDVPAGTHVDIVINSYSDQKVTGSDRYAGAYGNYNFVLSKQQNGDWKVTDFVRCT